MPEKWEEARGAVESALRDIAEALRISPGLEMREVDVIGGEDFYVGAERKPDAVFAVRARESNDPSISATVDTALTWTWAQDGRSSVYVTAPSGLTSGTGYTVTLILAWSR